MWRRTMKTMAKDEILARNDCFNCGAEATYKPKGDDLIVVDCCNIDCPVSQVVRATVDEIANHDKQTAAREKAFHAQGNVLEPQI
jgi:hypothetical protein